MSTTMKTKTSLLEGPDGSPGFSTEFKLSPDELSRLRGVIYAQYFARLAVLRPDLAETLNSVPMDQYHTIAHLIDHKSAWPKAELSRPKRPSPRFAASP